MLGAILGDIVVIVPDNGMKYLSTPMYRQK
jgi:cysteine synthase